MTYVISVVFIFSNIPKLFLRLAVSTHLEETSRNYMGKTTFLQST